MAIRSLTPVWTHEAKAHFTRMSPIDRDLSVEVVVVGAGVSGALAAHELARHGGEVVVVDRGQPAAGSSAACTALVQYDLDEPLIGLAKRYPREFADEVYRTSDAALGWLETHIASLKHPCAFKRRESLLVASRRRDVKPMKQELDARSAAGIGVEWVEREELESEYGIARDGAIRSENSIELDPYQLTIATLNAAVERGARVHAPAAVAAYEFDDAGVTLQLRHGPKLRARKVVVANGYATPPFLRQDYGTLLSTWAAASEPVDLHKYWRRGQLVWEWGRPYLYARSMPDGRIIFGGGDERFTNPTLRDALIPTKTASLVKQMRDLMPNLELKPAYEWAGTFAETDDAMPYIGLHPDFPNTLLTLGYGGNGVTFSMIAARVITGIICDDASLRGPQHLFRFDR